MRNANISFPAESFLETDFELEAAKKLLRERWMHGRLDEDTVVCANDNMAVGVIKALSETGLKIPEQIAVAGADNINIGSFITPSLTTFDYLLFAQGRTAFVLLHDIITGRREVQNIVLKSSLLIRRSA